MALAHLPGLLRVREEPHVIHEDRELLAELKEITTHVTDFVISILGAAPINPQPQRELAERLLTTGQLLLDHTNAGHIINGYVNGLVNPDLKQHLLIRTGVNLTKPDDETDAVVGTSTMDALIHPRGATG
jgi:hypothetical protein